ncbi:piggyBac transposable element-derived protein 4 [Trichonephila clavipes]|nr:piggyBac transposable element-derived protein 4 [Trichonephila clavipes]
MRQARHLPQRWYWSIVVQVRDVIRQFTQGTPNCNTNPKATVFGIPKEPVLESAELITSRLTGAGSLLPPVYGEAWAKGHATGTPDSTFPRHTLIQSKMTRRRGLTNEEMKEILEESDNEYIDFDDEIDDPDVQDPAHNLQYSSDSDECEMDIDYDTIPQNEKNSDALSDTDTASLSSVDEMPSANASGCRPIL